MQEDEPKLTRLEAGYYETDLSGVRVSLMQCGDGRWRIYRGTEGSNRWVSYRRGIEPIAVFTTLKDAKRALALGLLVGNGKG